MQTGRQRPPEPVARLLPEPARRTAAWCAVVLLVAGVAWVGIRLCVEFKTAVVPVLLALLATGLLRPVHLALRRAKVQQSLSAGLTCALILVVVGGAGYVVVRALIDTGDEIVASVKQAVKDLSEHFGTRVIDLNNLAGNAQDLIKKYGGSAASGVINGLSIAGEIAAMAVLALLLSFFFLRDAGRFRRALRQAAPGPGGETLEAIARRAFAAISGFMRGTTLIALIDATFIGVGLLVLRVPGAVGLAALVFVGAYIPYLGAFISGAVAILVALADRGFVIAAWALAVVLAVQVLEGHVLQPLIQSRTVQMHPAAVLLALTAGASVAGILGMLLAVPLTAAAFGVVNELRARYAGGGGADAGVVSRETGTETGGGGVGGGGPGQGFGPGS
ncbi:AI-2E family transporter [Streptomyces beihaiensis]|uniref:AI-2E family transporter n=1 Tax=Streptomyces beihaiensis TaxID=2984495 RepID=A0ABT3TTT0_9ACTN|nr:AI-2E family transporter [Streptomyces beihaiensis]MCX3060443.1 AI-2E family transporter [Streptomyces beihaiensis]